MASNYKNSLIVSVAILAAGFLVSHAIVVRALSKNDIVFPVQALGNCGSEAECRAYCNQPENSSACLTFAKEYNLVPQDQIDRWQKFADIAASGGPGGCKSEKECVNYCEDSSHIVECTDFVAKYNLVSADELAQMQKIAAAVKQGAQLPGGCNSKDACEAYCEDSSHIDECLAFAEKAQLIPPQELADAQKVAPFLKSGTTPGGCKTKADCEAYCQNDTNINECVDFWVKAGFIKPEDADIIKKTGGKSPGGCKSKEACEAYCKDDAHIDECVDFAVKAGLITPDEAAEAKKYKITSGPGGCQSKADCESFCAIPENGDTCFNWAVDHGMISKEDLQQIEDQRKQAVENFSKADPRWLACMEQKIGSEALQRLKEGKTARSESQSVGEAQKTCADELNLPDPNAPDLSGAAPEWLACMEQNLGSDLFARFKNGTLRELDFQLLGDAQKTCQSSLGVDMRQLIKECVAKPNCSEFLACLDKLPKGKRQPSGQQQQDTSGLPDRLKACQEESIDNCLSKSCSEFDACIKAVQNGASQQGSNGGSSGEGQIPEEPKIQAKATACTQEKINACLTKPCSEFQACLNSLGGGGGGGQQGQGTPNPAIIAKINSCAPQTGGGNQSNVDCSAFASVPSCSYITDPQGNSLCKQCFPNK